MLQRGSKISYLRQQEMSTTSKPNKGILPAIFFLLLASFEPTGWSAISNNWKKEVWNLFNGLTEGVTKTVLYKIMTRRFRKLTRPEVILLHVAAQIQRDINSYHGQHNLDSQCYMNIPCAENNLWSCQRASLITALVKVYICKLWICVSSYAFYKCFGKLIL